MPYIIGFLCALAAMCISLRAFKKECAHDKMWIEMTSRPNTSAFAIILLCAVWPLLITLLGIAVAYEAIRND